MDFHQLYYFKAIAESKTMSEAADKLHISQPSLSRALRQIEEETGVQLFDRKGIPAGHADDTCIAQLNFIQIVLELALLVVPEDDAALVVVREGGSKALIEVEGYFFSVHLGTPQCLLLIMLVSALSADTITEMSLISPMSNSK